MAQLTDYDITESMIRFGGGFVQGLGRLFRQGDAVNQERLRHAFPEYFARYRGLAIQKLSKGDGFTCSCGVPERAHLDGWDGSRLDCEEATRRSGGR